MEHFTRRAFLRDAGSLVAAFGAGCVFRVPSGTLSGGKPNLTFGALSDIHVKKEGSQTVFRQALRHFRDAGADAVVLAGDLTDNGLAAQLGIVADTWFSIFPNDCAPDGKKVERVFVTGNHDALQMNVHAHDFSRWWSEAFHEDYEPIFRKTIRGYDFIGANWLIPGCRGSEDAFCPAMSDFYARIGPTLPQDKPFFHVQHPHPKETVHGPNVWGQDDGTSVKILSRYPNAVSFSGHSHNSLLDERAIWQGAFTSVATGTTYAISSSALPSEVPYGFENYKTYGGKKVAAYNHVRVMPMIDRGAVPQCQIVRVYDDRIVFARLHALTAQPLGDDLVLPLPSTQSKPFAFAPRERVAKTPAFPKDAVLSFSPCAFKRRDAKVGDRPIPCVEVSAPAALAEPRARGVRYRIVAEGETGERLTLEVLHDAFRYAADDARAKAPVRCPIALERLPKGVVRFTMEAFSWWGKRSRRLVARYSPGV